MQVDSTLDSPARATWPVSAMILLNAFAVPLMLSAANVALPTISEALSLTALALIWVPMIFLMASAMAVLVFGRLGDIFGRKHIFLLGTVAMVLSSLLAAAALNGTVLLIARFLQGLSAGMIYSTQMAIVSAAFPVKKRGRMIGWVLAGVYSGLAVGPTVGGYLVEHIHWRAAFLAHVPLALLIAYLGWVLVRDEWYAEHKPSFDYSGAITYVSGIGLICFGVSLVPELHGGLILLAGALCMIIFFHNARRKLEPIWDVKLFFTERVFTFSCLASFAMYTATYANAVLISLFLQFIQQEGAAYTGCIMMLQPVTMALFSPLFGRLSDRIQPRILASAGMLLTAVALGMLSQLHSQSHAVAYILPLLLTGFGFSLFSSPNTNAIMSSVPKHHLGHAASATATMRILGQLASMALVTMLVAWQVGAVQLEASQYPQLERAIGFSFSLSAALCVIGCALSLNRGRLS